MTWNGKRKYSDFVNVLGRGDIGVFQYLYHPTINQTEIAGEAIYVGVTDPANLTPATYDCTTGYLAGQQATLQKSLTKYADTVKQVFTKCQQNDVSEAEIMEFEQSAVISVFNEVMPLIYADVIANGTDLGYSDATPTSTQLAASLLSALTSIRANGGGPGAIILDSTTGGSTLLGLSGMYQPASALDVDFSYGPGLPVGNILGFPIFVSPDSLATAAATPEEVDFIIMAKKGYAIANADSNNRLGFVSSLETHDGCRNIITNACLGYGVLNALLVGYVTRSDS